MKKRLNSLYRCDVIGSRCKLNVCDKYKVCNKAAKKNYKAWKDAYRRDKREELERLMGGGI